MEQLTGHVIICGFGRVGRRAAREFTELGAPFVVLDIGSEAIEVARAQGVPYVGGSGTRDEGPDSVLEGGDVIIGVGTIEEMFASSWAAGD